MKKIISVLLAALTAAGFLSACHFGSGSFEANTKEAVGQSAGNPSLSIVTTIFPEYDWVRNILGDNPGGADVTMLLDKGVDLHSYQPTAEDLGKVSDCSLFVYVGGESDGWVEDALKEARNKNMRTVNLLEALGSSVKEEELVEGMQDEEEFAAVGSAAEPEKAGTNVGSAVCVTRVFSTYKEDGTVFASLEEAEMCE